MTSVESRQISILSADLECRAKFYHNSNSFNILPICLHHLLWLCFLALFCSTSHSSAVNGPVKVPQTEGYSGPREIYFRGRANLQAVFQYLLQNKGLSGATDVILSGGSAGATSVYLAVDEISTWLPSTTRLVATPDAGFFVDAVDYQHGAPLYRQSFIAADPVWNSSAAGNLNADCLAAWAPQGEPWRCFLQQYAAQYIRTPTFIVNSAYDMWQVLNDLNLGCVPSTNGQPVAGNPSCNATRLAVMDAYRTQQLQAMAPVFNGYPGNGAYVDSCFVHEQNVDYCSTQPLPNCIGYNIYTVNVGMVNMTMNDAFFQWHSAVVANWDAVMEARAAHRGELMSSTTSNGNKEEDVSTLPRTRIDLASSVPSLYVIDATQWPNNPSCPFPTPKPQPVPGL